MRFEIVHRFDATPDELWAVLTHPRLAEVMVNEVPSLVEMEVLEVREEGTKIHRRVRYRPAPLIKKIGPKTVEPHWMEWVEESEGTRSPLVLEYRNIPRVDSVAKLLRNSGTMEIRKDGAGTRRIISGELRVRFPLLGRIAEKVIYGQAKGLLDEEAAAMRTILAAGGVDAAAG